MPTSTILAELTRPNPEADASHTSGGSNTLSNDWTYVTNWEEWTDFNFSTLRSMLKGVVEVEWKDPPRPDQASSIDLEIWDEDLLEHILTKDVFPPRQRQRQRQKQRRCGRIRKAKKEIDDELRR